LKPLASHVAPDTYPGGHLFCHTFPALSQLLQSGSRRYVLCALDWCELCNGSHELFRETLAKAAGTERSNVAIQTLHQHTAPLVDLDAQKLLAGFGAAAAHVDPKWIDDVKDRLAASLRRSLTCLQPCDQIGAGQAQVPGVASSRRCRDEKGVIRPRWSDAGSAPLLSALPEGMIDPYLKTITFARAGKPLVRLHYYATHPQTRFADGRATSDFPVSRGRRWNVKKVCPRSTSPGVPGTLRWASTMTARTDLASN
jgi:hypothetical protein